MIPIKYLINVSNIAPYALGNNNALYTFGLVEAIVHYISFLRCHAIMPALQLFILLAINVFLAGKLFM